MGYIGTIAFIGIFITLFCFHRYKRTLMFCNTFTTLSSKKTFHSCKLYWKATIASFGIISALTFICGVTTYFEFNPYMLEYWMLPTIEIFIWANCFLFMAFLAYTEHKNDFISINLDYIEYKLGNKQETINAETIYSIQKNKKHFIFNFKDGRRKHLNIKAFAMLEDSEQICKLLFEFCERHAG